MDAVILANDAAFTPAALVIADNGCEVLLGNAADPPAAAEDVYVYDRWTKIYEEPTWPPPRPRLPRSVKWNARPHADGTLRLVAP
jgi:hypothetical protein